MNVSRTPAESARQVRPEQRKKKDHEHEVELCVQGIRALL